ncbi:MAG: hypothetical protein NTX64_12210 [Elusimicrobia bacterium]|nr:hypothetical protein [Elusimicrobiota bacterium]
MMDGAVALVGARAEQELLSHREDGVLDELAHQRALGLRKGPLEGGERRAGLTLGAHLPPAELRLVQDLVGGDLQDDLIAGESREELLELGLPERDVGQGDDRALRRVEPELVEEVVDLGLDEGLAAFLPGSGQNRVDLLEHGESIPRMRDATEAAAFSVESARWEKFCPRLRRPP